MSEFDKVSQPETGSESENMIKMTTKQWTATGTIIAAIALVAMLYLSPVQEENIASNSGTNNGLIVGKIEVKQEIGVPKPDINVSQLTENDPIDSGYQSNFLLSIKTEIPIKNLYVQANARRVIKMDVFPQRTGAAMFGHSGERDGFAFTNITDAYGDYKIRITTETPQEITFELSDE